MSINRRNLLKSVPAAVAAGGLGRSPGARADAHRVVVVGGGFGGATVAKYLSHWGGSSVDVTLVDPNAAHVSCIMSNLVLNRQLDIEDLSFDLGTLANAYGFSHVVGRAAGIDNSTDDSLSGGVLHLQSGEALPYDSLVLATGIGFEIPGGNYDPRLSPHGWIAGEQTTLLRDALDAMPDTGTYILSIPRSPYRCPPGPYERACAVADILGRRSGTLGGGSGPTGTPTVLVLDANSDIQAEKSTFSRAFEELYGNIIQYHRNTEVRTVDSGAGQVTTTDGTAYRGDLLNILPTHRAADLVVDIGLTGGDRWAPVDPASYESLLPEFRGVYIIGDSQATGQPKSGHMANAQAKICADAILRKAKGLSIHTDERLQNLRTNSACFSPVTADEASWLTAVFAYDTASSSMKLVPESLGEARSWSRENYREMFTWSENLFADTFR